MNRIANGSVSIRKIISALFAVTIIFGTVSVSAQQFDFGQLEKQVSRYTVIIDMTIEVSLGMNSAEHEDKFLGTIVSEDGLVIFNGSAFGPDNTVTMRGFSIKTEPIKIEVTTLDGDKYEASFVGVDRFSNIGFIQIKSESERKFESVNFSESKPLKVGSWLALFMLLPSFIEPPLAADIGMISTLVESPESFALTVGFNQLQMVSVLFDETLEPVGVLGPLMDPSSASLDQNGVIESIGQYGIPLLGVITGERLQKIIADPPQRGSNDRGWMGISLQALTEDIANFWEIDAVGGIIVNDVINNSPADKAGIQVGDIIIKYDHRPIEVEREEELPVFQRGIAELGPGTEIDLNIYRPGDKGIEELEISLILASTPLAARDADEYESESMELTVRDMVFSDYMINNLDEETFRGAVVSRLKQGGLANVGGLYIGDIIEKIGNEDVASSDDVRVILEKIQESRPREVIFFVWRDNKTMFVNVKTNWD